MTGDDEDGEDDEGAFRWTDPDTSREAARSFRVSPIVLKILRYLDRTREPRNGWEMSKALGMSTITVVPRLAPMRRLGLIQLVGTRPGPSGRSQGAYVISTMGRRLVADAQ